MYCSGRAQTAASGTQTHASLQLREAMRRCCSGREQMVVSTDDLERPADHGWLSIYR